MSSMYRSSQRSNATPASGDHDGRNLRRRPREPQISESTANAVSRFVNEDSQVARLSTLCNRSNKAEVRHVLQNIKRAQVIYAQGIDTNQNGGLDNECFLLLIDIIRHGITWSLNLGEIKFTGAQLDELLTTVQASNLAQVYLEPNFLPRGYYHKLNAAVIANQAKHDRWRRQNDHSAQDGVVAQAGMTWRPGKAHHSSAGPAASAPLPPPAPGSEVDSADFDRDTDCEPDLADHYWSWLGGDEHVARPAQPLWLTLANGSTATTPAATSARTAPAPPRASRADAARNARPSESPASSGTSEDEMTFDALRARRSAGIASGADKPAAVSTNAAPEGAPNVSTSASTLHPTDDSDGDCSDDEDSDHPVDRSDAPADDEWSRKVLNDWAIGKMIEPAPDKWRLPELVAWPTVSKSAWEYLRKKIPPPAPVPIRGWVVRAWLTSSTVRAWMKRSTNDHEPLTVFWSAIAYGQDAGEVHHSVIRFEATSRSVLYKPEWRAELQVRLGYYEDAVSHSASGLTVLQSIDLWHALLARGPEWHAPLSRVIRRSKRAVSDAIHACRGNEKRGAIQWQAANIFILARIAAGHLWCQDWLTQSTKNLNDLVGAQSDVPNAKGLTATQLRVLKAVHSGAAVSPGPLDTSRNAPLSTHHLLSIDGVGRAVCPTNIAHGTSIRTVVTVEVGASLRVEGGPLWQTAMSSTLRRHGADYHRVQISYDSDFSTVANRIFELTGVTTRCEIIFICDTDALIQTHEGDENWATSRTDKAFQCITTIHASVSARRYAVSYVAAWEGNVGENREWCAKLRGWADTTHDGSCAHELDLQSFDSSTSEYLWTAAEISHKFTDVSLQIQGHEHSLSAVRIGEWDPAEPHSHEHARRRAHADAKHRKGRGTKCLGCMSNDHIYLGDEQPGTSSRRHEPNEYSDLELQHNYFTHCLSEGVLRKYTSSVNNVFDDSRPFRLGCCQKDDLTCMLDQPPAKDKLNTTGRHRWTIGGKRSVSKVGRPFVALHMKHHVPQLYYAEFIEGIATREGEFYHMGRIWLSFCAGFHSDMLAARRAGYRYVPIDILDLVYGFQGWEPNHVSDFTTDAIYDVVARVLGGEDELRAIGVVHVHLPCETHSVLNHGHHRDEHGAPRTDRAREVDMMIVAVRQFLRQLAVLRASPLSCSCGQNWPAPCEGR